MFCPLSVVYWSVSVSPYVVIIVYLCQHECLSVYLCLIVVFSLLTSVCSQVHLGVSYPGMRRERKKEDRKG